MSCKTCQSAREKGELFCYGCWDELEPISYFDNFGDAIGSEDWPDDFNLDVEQDESQSDADAAEARFVESGAQLWYREYFDYVGDFVEGVAPVWRSPRNMKWRGCQKAGYVVAEKTNYLYDTYTPEELCDDYIFGDGPVKLAVAVENPIWTGEFRDGIALVVVVNDQDGSENSTLHIIDRHGNTEKLGFVHKQAGPVRKDGKLASFFFCTLVANDKERDCVVSRKGEFIRDRGEHILPLCDGEVGFARVATIVSPDDRLRREPHNPFRLVRISDGHVVSTGNSLIEGQLLELPDGSCEWFVRVEKKLQGAESGQPTHLCGYYMHKEGLVSEILTLNYESIEIISDGRTVNPLAPPKFLNFFLCLGKENDDEGSTWYNMGVANQYGEVVYEYKSLGSAYAVIEGRVFAIVQERQGCRVVGLDGQGLFSLPGAIKLQHFAQGYFRVENADKQCGLVNAAGEFTIPYGRFDDLLGFSADATLAIKANQNGLVEHVNVFGHVLVPLKHEDIHDDYPLADDAVSAV